MNDNEREMSEKRKALEELCNQHILCSEGCPLDSAVCQAARGKYFTSAPGAGAYVTDDEINAAYAIAFPDDVPHIKDSGSRTEFSTGAVRDVQALEKGRCDLLPLDVIGEITGDPVIVRIADFIETGDRGFLGMALDAFSGYCNWPDMYLEVAIHMAEGCQKYGENNWQKGIPLPRYIDSGVRHYLKWLRGDKDEPHDRAFCWNIMCAIWTCKHKPELNPYGSGIAKRRENVFADDQEV